MTDPGPAGGPAAPATGELNDRPDQQVIATEPPPRLAEGIELVGQFEDSGFKEPPFIARRSDGQVVQMPEMLYRLAEQVDGSRSYGEVAELMSAAVERDVDADAVRFLAEEKLRPLGVLANADGSSQRLQKLDPLLALRFKAGVVSERVTYALTTVFRPLFWGPVVVAVVLAMVALDGWLLFVHGIAASTREVIYQPALLLMLFGAVVLSTAFHETGHATACRYGGATPGKMGVGIYIIWPVFYTDVTDAYRLSRRGRLRTDLGGIYFNAIFALAVAGVYLATGFEALLLIVLLQNFAMLQQMLPFVRLDGYYVISDLTGVPDMFSRIKPALKSLIPGRGMDARVTELKSWVRGVVASYVAVLVPLIALVLLLLAIQAPRIFATAYDSVLVKYEAARAAFGDSSVLTGIGNSVQIVALVLPSLGIALTSVRILQRVGKGVWSWSADGPLRRASVVALGAAAAGLIAFIWWPNGDYRPIQPSERGTLQGGVASLRDVPSGRPSLGARRADELGGAPFVRDAEPGRGDSDGGRSPGDDGSGPGDPGTPGAPGVPPGGAAPGSTTPVPTSTTPTDEEPPAFPPLETTPTDPTTAPTTTAPTTTAPTTTAPTTTAPTSTAPIPTDTAPTTSPAPESVPAPSTTAPSTSAPPPAAIPTMPGAAIPPAPDAAIPTPAPTEVAP